MTLEIARFSPYLMAGSLAALVYFAFSALRRRGNSAARVLADYYQPLNTEEKQSIRTGSFEHRMRLAALRYHMNVAGKEKLFFYGVAALISLVLLTFLTLAGVPVGMYLLAPLGGYFTARGQVNSAWSKMRLVLEKELPTFLLRMSATIQATPNVPEAVADVADSLDPSGPLRAWMLRLLAALQAQGRKGLEEMQAEAAAISPSLLMAVMELGRLWETGGSGYVEAFRLAADNLSTILGERATAAAKADGAWGTVRVILLALGGTLVMILSSSASSRLFNTPLMQIGLLLAAGWAALGWSVIGDMIREVME